MNDLACILANISKATEETARAKQELEAWVDENITTSEARWALHWATDSMAAQSRKLAREEAARPKRKRGRR